MMLNGQFEVPLRLAMQTLTFDCVVLLRDYRRNIRGISRTKCTVLRG